MERSTLTGTLPQRNFFTQATECMKLYATVSHWPMCHCVHLCSVSVFLCFRAHSVSSTPTYSLVSRVFSYDLFLFLPFLLAFPVMGQPFLASKMGSEEPDAWRRTVVICFGKEEVTKHESYGCFEPDGVSSEAGHLYLSCWDQNWRKSHETLFE